MKNELSKNFRKRAGVFCAAFMLWGLGQNAWGQYGGQLVSATPQSPIALGQPLNITVVVHNDSGEVWEPGEPGSGWDFSWMVSVSDMFWNPGVTFNYVSDATVYDGSTVTVRLTLDPADLPTSPGTYSASITTSWNFWNFWLSYMDGCPQTVNFTINAANHAPVIAAIGDKVVVDTNLLSFTASATDSDTPAQTLTFGLVAGAPAGASITTNGLFSWAPPAGYAPRTNQISVYVTDNGAPPLSATNSFKVVVLKPLRFQAPTRPANGAMRLVWESYPGKTYRVRYRDDVALGTWTNVDVVATGTLGSITNVLGTTRQRYYQLLLMD